MKKLFSLIFLIFPCLISEGQDFPKIEESFRINQLKSPAGKVRVVLDTDIYNEVDDQFALAYAFLSKEKIDLEAVYAAPFHNTRSEGPADGMEKSYEEILRLLKMLRKSGLRNLYDFFGIKVKFSLFAPEDYNRFSGEMKQQTIEWISKIFLIKQVPSCQ